MKVKDLIEQLKLMPQDKEVYVYEDGEYPVDIYSVTIDSDGEVGLNKK